MVYKEWKLLIVSNYISMQGKAILFPKVIKILIVLLIVLIGSGIDLCAQQLDADSLIFLYNRTTKKNDKVKLLNQIGNQLRYTNIEEAFPYLKESEMLSLQLENDEQLAESYIIQGIIWYERKKIDTAFYYLHKGLSISTKCHYYNGIVKSLNSIGMYKYFEKNYKDALDTYKDALGYVNRVDDMELIIMLYNNLAMLYKIIGEYDFAIEYYHMSLSLCEERNNYKGKGIVCSNLGLLYEKQRKNNLALEYLNKSLEIRRFMNNLKGESYVLNNLGVIYEGMGLYEKALEKYRQSLKIKEQLNQKNGIAKLYNNIGIIQKGLGRLDSAHFYYVKSLLISQKLNDKSGESRTLTNFGVLHHLEGDYKVAVMNFYDAAQIAEESGDIEELVRIYKGMSKSLYAIEKYKEAFDYFAKYQIMYDSLYNIKSKKYIEEIEGKYQNLKKEKENQALLKDNLLKTLQLKRQVIISILIILLTVLVLIVLIVVVRNKIKQAKINDLLLLKNTEIKKQSNELEIAYKELKDLSSFKEDMTNMIVHDLKNPLNIIMNSHFLNKNEIGESISKSAIQMHNLITNMLDVHKYKETDMHLKLDKNNMYDIIHIAVSQIEIFLKEKTISLTINVNKLLFVVVDKELMIRVVVNLLTNAIKYTPVEGEIEILAKEQNNLVEISVSDSGCGIPEDKLDIIFNKFEQVYSGNSERMKSSGLGLTFCKLVVESHGGKIGVFSKINKGSRFWLTLPKTVRKVQGDFESSKSILENSLLPEDIEYLLYFAKQLQNKEIFEVSAINNILKLVEKKSFGIINWAEQVKESVYQESRKRFNELIYFKSRV